MSRDSITLKDKLAAILSVFMLIVPIIIGLRYQEIMQASDFSMTFYVVGNMLVHGQLESIYPPLSSTSLIHTPFDNYAHQLLDKLPPRNVAIYMYSPLTAVLFAPLGMLNPVVALAVWQSVIVLSTLFCMTLLSPTGRAAPLNARLLSWVALFAPTIHQILIGHLSVPLGMLPLCLGYFLLSKEKNYLAGAVWSLLFLKPQFLPVALLFVGCFTLMKRWQVLIGFLGGSLVMGLLSTFLLGPDILAKWLHCLKFSDTIFTNPAYNYPHYLAISIPSVVLQMLPTGVTGTAKLILYPLAFLTGVFTLLFCTNLLKKFGAKTSLPMILVLSVLVLPLVLPHFLYYDLVCFIAAALVIQSGSLPAEVEPALKRGCMIVYAIINLYFVDFFFVQADCHFIAPLLLVTALTAAFLLAVWKLSKVKSA